MHKTVSARSKAKAGDATVTTVPTRYQHSGPDSNSSLHFPGRPPLRYQCDRERQERLADKQTAGTHHYM